jgi:hypothetical protein
VHDHTMCSYLNGFCRNILILLNHCRNSSEIHNIGILLKCNGFRGEQFTFCFLSHCYCSMLRDTQDSEARKVTVDTDGLIGPDVLEIYDCTSNILVDGTCHLDAHFKAF